MVAESKSDCQHKKSKWEEIDLWVAMVYEDGERSQKKNKRGAKSETWIDLPPQISPES